MVQAMTGLHCHKHTHRLSVSIHCLSHHRTDPHNHSAGVYVLVLSVPQTLPQTLPNTALHRKTLLTIRTTSKVETLSLLINDVEILHDSLLHEE